MIKTRDDALIELGFEPNSEPSAEEIKKNYRKKALKVHPDKNPSADANAKFVTLTEAFTFLSKPRDLQDKPNSDASHVPFTASNAQDFFAQFFNFSDSFFESFFANMKETPYKMHAYTVTRNGNSNSRIGKDYFIEDAEDLKRQCQQNFSRINKLTIVDIDLQLPPEGSEIILTSLLGNQSLLNVKYPDNFFDNTQIERLTNHLARNNASRKNVAYKNQERLMMLLGATIGLCVFTATGGVSSSALLTAVLGSISAYVITKAHQVYLKFAASYYNTPDKIIAVSNPKEQAALLAGTNAKRFGGYLKSFMNLATYTHPLAFAAGLFHSLEYNYAIKQLISSAFTKPFQDKLDDLSTKETVTKSDETTAPNTIHATPLTTPVSQEKRDVQPSAIPAYRISVSIVTKTGFMTTTMSFSDKLSLSKRLGNDVTKFTLHEDKGNLLPQNGAAMIVEELLKQNNLISADFPPGFLSDEQTSVLQTSISQNNHLQALKKLRVQNREKQSERRWVASGATLAIGAAVLTGQAYWLVLCYGAMTGYMSYQLKRIRDLLAQTHYQDSKSIVTSSVTEQKALKVGAEANTWRGYVTSFMHWQTYRHPQAFATAMQHAENENKQLIKTIRALP